MSIRLNYNNMMKHTIGEQGISEIEYSSHTTLAQFAHAKVEEGRGKGMQGWMDSPYNQKEVVKLINATAKRIRKTCDSFVVLGIGGSALGPIAVFTALKHLYYNELPKKVRKGPKFYVIDNVDPEKMNALFDVIDIEKTVFNVITKSGATSETMSQYLIVMDMLKAKLGDKASEHIIATTSEYKGNLIKIAKDNNIETFYIPEGVGGRFSELSPVGLLPAAVVGIDIAEMLRGARDMDRKCKTNDMWRNPALAIATLQYISIKSGKNIGVIMPYADSLKYIADWYAQLWAESLGKEVDNDGNKVNVGQTPVKALGVTDQHSQVQLFNEGPYDKVITFIEVGQFRSEMNIPNGCEEYPDVNFLCGHSLGELMNNELYATRYNLVQQHRANYTIYLEAIDEFHIGALLYLMELQTAYAGAMFDIDVYNQPGVEGGKNATYALFGRKGYESKAQEIKNAKPDDTKYII
ncbi:MAG: glucose-6-phosphate isomerase [Clostridiales bacterium]|nr:glucose-6-phosphate isomerase [Clostridiales bacterium]